MSVRTYKSVLFLLIITLLGSSCSNTQVFRMEVLKPGYVVVPSQKSNIVMVDNTGKQPKNVGHIVKTNFKYDSDTAFNTEPLSGLLISSLSNYLLKEGFYKRITSIFRDEMPTAKNGEEDYVRSSRLPNAEIMKFSRDTSLHLLFSMDRLLTKTITNVYYTGESYAATRDVWVNTVWRIYDLDMDTLVTQFQYNDSLYWRKFSESPRALAKLLPEMDDVLPEIGDVVAEHLNAFLGPHWGTEKRVYFSTGGFRMKMAADLVRKEQIDAAAELWKVECQKGLFRSKYRAAINMMLFEEVKGNPIEALKWVEKAEKAMEECPIGPADNDVILLKQWKVLLNERAKDFQTLKLYFDGNLN